jgi:hypothetical protein
MKKQIINFGGCFFIVIFMTLLSFIWKDWCNHYFSNDAHCYFYQNRLEDIKNVTICTFEEEFIWRALPILIFSILIKIFKLKWAKIFIIITCITVILCLQLQFGAMHFCNDIDTDRIKPMIIHGVAGIIFTITYVTILYQVKNINKEKYPTFKPKTLLIEHSLGYCSAVIVHAISNILVVITETF